MDMSTFQACIAGYMARLKDQQILALMSGHWAGYYSRAKKPAPLKTMINKITANASKLQKKHANEVDVEGFLAMDEKFKNFLKK